MPWDWRGATPSKLTSKAREAGRNGIPAGRLTDGSDRDLGYGLCRGWVAIAPRHQQAGEVFRSGPQLNPQTRHRAAISTVFAALVMQAPAQAGLISGLVAVQTGRPLLPSLPLGRLPASWRGDLAFAGGRTRWQLDLLADGSFQLRQTFLERPAPNRFDDIGRWRIEPGSNRLVLRGGLEAPLFFQPLEGGAALAKLDLQGEPLRSRQPDRLQRLATPQPIDPRLHLAGMFRYQADAATIRLCATGARLPVAMEADYRRLERAYLKAQPAGRPGQPLLVNLEGLITNRPSAEPGRPPQRTLVVERFVGVHPGQGCPQANALATPAVRPISQPSQRGTL